MALSRKPSLLRDLQFRLEYALLRLVVGFVRLFPLEAAAAFSAKAWRFLAPRVNAKRHRRALDNLKIAFPDQPESWRHDIAMRHWENLGRVMVETMQIDRLLADPSRLDYDRDGALMRYAGKIGPIVAVSLHQGNWELGIYPLVAVDAYPAAVYRSVNNPYVDEFIRRQRRDLCPAGLFGRGKVEGEHGEAETARAIMEFVRKGGRLGLICDLFDRRGIAVPFFGKDAKSVVMPAMMARRTGARVWIGRCKRLGPSSRFKIELREIKLPRSRDQVADIKALTAAMQLQFEAWIRDAPEQWMWSNRRWS